MKSLIPIILILLSTNTFSQERGKLVRNQSVKCIILQVDTLNLWMVALVNSSECKSIIEFKVNGEMLDTAVLDKDESQDMMIHGDFKIKFRNATTCNGGSTQWMFIDNILSAPSIDFSIQSNQKSKNVQSCETIIIEPYVPPSDSDIITKQRLYKTN